MVNNNLVLYFGKIMGELLTDILYFPLWWYTRGLLIVVGKISKFWAERQKGLALFVWVKNIFTPMYGQSDWQGRLVSIFIRLVQIVFRSIAMVFWLIAGAVLILAWLGLPLLVAAQILFQLIPGALLK